MLGAVVMRAEQGSEYWDLMYERHPLLGVVFLDLINASDDGRTAVAHHEPRLRAACRQCRAGAALDIETCCRLVLLHLDVHDHGAGLGDLRSYRQPQRGIDVLNRGGEV